MPRGITAREPVDGRMHHCTVTAPAQATCDAASSGDKMILAAAVVVVVVVVVGFGLGRGTSSIGQDPDASAASGSGLGQGQGPCAFVVRGTSPSGIYFALTATIVGIWLPY